MRKLCEACSNTGVARVMEQLGVRCRVCSPVPDLIRVEGIEFTRSEVGTLKTHQPRRRAGPTHTIISAAKARDLATFLIQNFCAPGDY